MSKVYYTERYVTVIGACFLHSGNYLLNIAAIPLP